MKSYSQQQLINEWRKKYGKPGKDDFAIEVADATDLIELCRHGEMLHTQNTPSGWTDRDI